MLGLYFLDTHRSATKYPNLGAGAPICSTVLAMGYACDDWWSEFSDFLPTIQSLFEIMSKEKVPQNWGTFLILRYIHSRFAPQVQH